jgi:hypothetical protein
MGWFRKKPDPISDRARALNDDIARLESQIRELDGELQRDQTQPRLRSTALPRSSTIIHGTPPPPPPPPPAPVTHEPIFEEVGQHVLEARSEATTTPDHYNELGMRKYDLPALLRRLKEHFRGPSTTNPKLVSYLAAGGIQGLRPLRYEKRVARNRFIFFVIFLVLILLGTFVVFLKGHR